MNWTGRKNSSAKRAVNICQVITHQTEGICAGLVLIVTGISPRRLRGLLGSIKGKVPCFSLKQRFRAKISDKGSYRSGIFCAIYHAWNARTR